MKRVILLVCLIVLSMLMVSCSESVSQDEVRTVLGDLIPKSQELNRVFWGEALKPADENAEALASVDAAQYYPVAPDSAYTSIAQLKAAAEQVFTAEYLKSVYAMSFEGLEDFPPRFSENKDGLLLMDITYETYTFNTVLYPETAVILDRKGDTVRVELDVLTNGQEEKMALTLKKQGEAWLLDSPTY